MSYQATKRRGGTLNAHHSVKEASERAPSCRIPILRHLGKGKTVETVGRSVVTRGWGVGDEKVELRGFLGQ